ncbi:hypothetical protein AB0L39_14475 [Streptomyces parvus]|uniref:hypothetical protein n=1 Tax=Streptomyces parvus TaxID=66428 RepID=UPI003423746B
MRPRMSAADVVEGATGTTDVVRPVPVAARADGAAFSTAVDDVTVNVPASADGEVEAVGANGEAVRIGLAGARPVPGVRSDAGTVAYADVKHSALAEDGSGGYLITRGAGGHKLVVGTIDAPWATDAAGRPVPTDYRLEGVTLVQTVAPPSETTFPVVADPKLTYGVGIYLNATGAEWKSYAIAAGGVGYFANMVGCAQLICSVIGYKTLKDYGAFLKKVVKDKKLSPGSRYQTRLTPKNGELTKVSAENCT